GMRRLPRRGVNLAKCVAVLWAGTTNLDHPNTLALRFPRAASNAARGAHGHPRSSPATHAETDETAGATVVQDEREPVLGSTHLDVERSAVGESEMRHARDYHRTGAYVRMLLRARRRRSALSNGRELRRAAGDR